MEDPATKHKKRSAPPDAAVKRAKKPKPPTEASGLVEGASQYMFMEYNNDAASSKRSKDPSRAAPAVAPAPSLPGVPPSPAKPTMTMGSNDLLNHIIASAGAVPAAAPLSAPSLHPDEPQAAPASVPTTGKSRKAHVQSQEKLSARWHNAGEISVLEQTEGVQLRRGKFTQREDEILEKTVQEYLSTNRLTEDDLRSYLFRDRSAEDKDGRFRGFWNFVAGEMKERSMHSLYSHLKRIHHPGNHLGAFSPAEDDTLKRLVVQHGTSWSKIGAAMGRMPASCRDRFRDINATKHMSGQWLQHENDALRDAIVAATGNKGAIPESDIPWDVVSRAVKTRSPHQCRTHWYTYLSIREHKKDANPVWEAHEDIALLDRLIELEYDDERDIQWSTVAKGPLQAWGTDRCRERWGVIKKTVGDQAQTKKLDEILSSLRSTWEERRRTIRRAFARRPAAMKDNVEE